MIKLNDCENVMGPVHIKAKSYSCGDETILKANAVVINGRISLYTCNIDEKDYEMVKSSNRDELLDALKEKDYLGRIGIHTYVDPLTPVPANNRMMLFIAVLPTTDDVFEPNHPIVSVFN